MEECEMKLVGNIVLASVIMLSLSSVAKAGPQLLILKPDTNQILMPLFDRLASAQIISSVLSASIVGISAIICCLILKKKTNNHDAVNGK
jgi:hypothetical protein